MPRVKRGTKRNDRRKKILKRASGYFLTKSKLYQAAQEAVERGLKFAYIGRKQKKRQFRSLWIVRIGAAAKLNGISYSQLIHGLKLAGIELTDTYPWLMHQWIVIRQLCHASTGESVYQTLLRLLFCNTFRISLHNKSARIISCRVVIVMLDPKELPPVERQPFDSLKDISVGKTFLTASPCTQRFNP